MFIEGRIDQLPIIIGVVDGKYDVATFASDIIKGVRTIIDGIDKLPGRVEITDFPVDDDMLGALTGVEESLENLGNAVEIPPMGGETE